MNTQILVAYATKYGATAEIAEKIGQVLREAGLRTDVLPVDRVSDLSPYQAVVLGSAVYIGKWRKEAVKFLQANEKALAEKLVWLFSSGPTGVFKVFRWTGWFGLAGVIFIIIEIPLWILLGAAPLISDAVAHAQYLANIRVIALTRVLLDILMYMSLMVFFAGFRHLVVKRRPEYEWVGTLAFGAGVVWWAGSLVADGLEGGAVLNTLGGNVVLLAPELL